MTTLLERAPCPADAPLRVAVLASGSGTNLQALLDHRDGFEIVAVLCNRPEAKALERAEGAGVPALIVDHQAFGRDRATFEREMLHALSPYKPEVIVLAGFMRVLTEVFLDGVAAPVLNVHPALLPAFPGMHGARQALEHGARVAGCTVHLVDSGVDTGPILAQAAVPVLDDDDEAALQARIQAEEHRLLPRAVTAIARGDVVERGGRPHWTGLFSDSR